MTGLLRPLKVERNGHSAETSRHETMTSGNRGRGRGKGAFMARFGMRTLLKKLEATI